MASKILTRTLNAVDFGGLRVLETLRWPSLFGTSVRMYVASQSELEILRPKPESEVQLSGLGKIGDNAIGHGTAPAGQGPVTLDLGADKFELPTSAPETELFDNLDVILAQRHAESADDVATWLWFHVETHGATGVLIFDRAPLQEGFAQALAAQDLPDLKQLMVVNAPMPLGHLERPAHGHPALAPRAKDRRFKQDPWRSALAEPVLYDVLRWRFLSRAATVLALDPVDFLSATEEGISPFDACRHAHTGMIPIMGEAIFPWRIRKDSLPTFHDHICRSEPPARVQTRWAIAPKRIESGAVWLPQAIVGVTSMTDEALRYQRAMRLAFQNSEIPELINKDLLILDKTLLANALDNGQKPVQPPTKPDTNTAFVMAPPSGRTVIVTCMKNEGPFILEWVAYHRMIGVDDILIYTNDCDDGTEELLNRLQERGLVQRRDNPFRSTGAKPQQSALAAAQSEPLVQEAGWIISMDVDEFINVHVGGNRLNDLYDAVGDASLISLTWRLFGNSDIAEYEDRPIIEQFTRCAPQVIRRPHQAWGFKTLFRNQGAFKGIGVHRPRGFLGGKLRWVNGSGKDMPERIFQTGWRSDTQTVGYDLVTLNHYSCRSVESFLVKRDRGRVNHVSRDQGEGYWFRMNNNDEQDLSIQRHTQGVQDALAELMRDPEISEAHYACVTAHQAKIETLRKKPDFASFYKQLTGERMQKLSRMHRHFGMNVFLSGPSVVPDTVFDADLDPNFFFNTATPPGRAAE